MLIRTPTELGAIIRDKRKRLKLDQSTLANRIGVSRQWLIDARAWSSARRVGPRTAGARRFGHSVSTQAADELTKNRSSTKSGVDINAIVWPKPRRAKDDERTRLLFWMGKEVGRVRIATRADGLTFVYDNELAAKNRAPIRYRSPCRLRPKQHGPVPSVQAYLVGPSARQ